MLNIDCFVFILEVDSPPWKIPGKEYIIAWFNRFLHNSLFLILLKLFDHKNNVVAFICFSTLGAFLQFSYNDSPHRKKSLTLFSFSLQTFCFCGWDKKKKKWSSSGGHLTAHCCASLPAVPCSISLLSQEPEGSAWSKRIIQVHRGGRRENETSGAEGTKK